MAHPQRERVAAVLGESQGSGYLLTPRLVLTAAHLLGKGTPRVIVDGGSGPVPCEVLWLTYDDACDVALLLAASDVVPPDTFLERKRLIWGRIEDLTPRPGAFAVGFPSMQRDDMGELDSEQLVGTLKPASGMLRGRQVLDSQHGAPRPRSGEGSPWAGFSGAAVFLEDHLVGIVRADPSQWQHGRLEITSTVAILNAPGFHPAVLSANHSTTFRFLDPPPTRENFEDRLRAYVAKQAGGLHIIGLNRGGEDAESWPLDTSYLSLELLGGSPGRDEGDLAPVTQRAELALSGHRRILVRGSAGSGKTTLLQWLATAAAQRELPSSLAELADCVPLLIRLRSIAQRDELPAPEEFLPIVAKPLAGHARAAGWVTEQMQQGRILLLVDGVDEVPEADRERTRAWLTELMDAYPDVRYVVTTRPSAVREGWLTRVGFTELELLPMSRGDVAAFIGKWHAAAASVSSPQTADQYERWRNTLTTAVVTKQDLGRLATSPLLCALTCALNRDRNGYLPEGRMELYAAALEMLLVRRDLERGITGPDGLRLSADQQVQLLQRLAWWLATNGQVEIGHELAVKILGTVLPSMPAITGAPEEVLRHLLVRSGLLRQPTAETVDFVHRTFQDYLAAKAAIEDESLGVLARNAHDDQWEDVLRMAVGHARPRERAKLLRSLLAQAEEDPVHGNRLRLLAAASLEHATELDPAVRQEVTAAATALVPPHDEESAKELATAGPVILDLLPGPEGLDGTTARAVVIAASLVGGGRAIPLLQKYADHPVTSVRGQLSWAWDRFDTREYGEQVIARLTDGDGLRFVAKSREHLDFLNEIGGRPLIECSGPMTQEDLRHLPAGIKELRIHDDPHTLDLAPVLAQSTPTSLWLSDCLGPISLAPLRRSDVQELFLHWNPELLHPEALAEAPALHSFAVAATADAALDGLRLPPALRKLDVGLFDVHPAKLIELLEPLTRLERLFFDAIKFPHHSRGVLKGLDRLERLRVIHESLPLLRGRRPLPQVSVLELLLPGELSALGGVAQAYPGLHTLRIEAPGLDGIEALVLDQLADLHGCQVEIRRHDTPVTPSIFGIGKSYVPTVSGFTIP